MPERTPRPIYPPSLPALRRARDAAMTDAEALARDDAVMALLGTVLATEPLGRRDAVIWEQGGMPPARYWQIVNRCVGTARYQHAHPVLCRLMRERRDAARRARGDAP